MKSKAILCEAIGIIEVNNIRIVGSEIEKDAWSDTVIYLHPHINDFMNTSGKDLRRIMKILEKFGACAFSGKDNAFLIKVKKTKKVS